jgi:hypothetical protein
MGRLRKGRRRPPAGIAASLGAIVCLIALAFGTLASVRASWPTRDPSPTDLPLLHDVPAEALARGRTVVIGESGGFALVNPLFAETEGELDLCEALFAPLQRLDAHGSPVAVLAASFSVEGTEEGTVVVFTLDPLRTFPDGTPVLPSDVAFTYAVLADPTYDGPLRGRFDAVLSVVGDDEAGTVTFTLSDDTMPASEDAGLFSVGILQARQFEESGSTPAALRAFDEVPDGAGDYRISESTPERIVLTLREGRTATVERLVFLSIAPDRKVSALADGTLDLARLERNARTTARLDLLQGCTSIPYPGSAALYLMLGSDLTLPGSGLDVTTRQRLLAAASTLADEWAMLPAGGPTAAGTPTSSPTPPTGSAVRHRSLFYFPGVDAADRADRAALAGILASRLNRELPSGSAPFVPEALGWPEIASLAFDDDAYDALLLPTAEDGRTPSALRLASGSSVAPDAAGTGSSGSGSESEANAVVMLRDPGVLVVSSRLSGVVPNPFAFPFHPVGVGFLDALRTAKPLDLSGTPLPTRMPTFSPGAQPTLPPDVSPTDEEAEPSGFIPRE